MPSQLVTALMVTVPPISLVVLILVKLLSIILGLLVAIVQFSPFPTQIQHASKKIAGIAVPQERCYQAWSGLFMLSVLIVILAVKDGFQESFPTASCLLDSIILTIFVTVAFVISSPVLLALAVLVRIPVILGHVIGSIFSRIANNASGRLPPSPPLPPPPINASLNASSTQPSYVELVIFATLCIASSFGLMFAAPWLLGVVVFSQVLLPMGRRFGPSIMLVRPPKLSTRASPAAEQFKTPLLESAEEPAEIR